MKLSTGVLIFFTLFLFSCQETNKQNLRLRTIKVVEAHGYVIPQDSIQQPKSISAGKPTVVKAGAPEVTPTNTNIHIAGIPTIIFAGIPKVITPGTDTFTLPKSFNIQHSKLNIITAGIPETFIAKDMANKDQNPQNFSTYGKLQGLKQSTVRCMLQDKNGNLWFGTDGGGVSKYDGKSFTTFTDKEGLSNNTVWSILEDKSGNLWFGAYGGGVSKYDGNSFTTFTDKEGLSNNTVWSILEDKSGNLWFGTYGGGVSKYDGKSFTTFSDKEGLSSNTVWSILEDKSGNLWFGTDGGGVSKYDGKSFTTFNEKEGLANNTVWSIIEDKNGNLWFGTDGGGVSKYDGKAFTTFSDKEGLSNNTVRIILEDKSGNLWFGTYGGGVSKYNGKFFTTFGDKEGLANNMVLSLLEDKSGNIWLGTDGGGVSKYNGKSFTTFSDKEGLANNMVLSLLEDKSGNLWFGTYGGGVSKYDGKSFTTFRDKEGLANNMVLSLLEDKSGNLWFGTHGSGVSKYDGKSFTTFTDKEGLANNTVWSILEDKSGNLWFGTDGGGVSKYDGKSFTTFSNKEGLANNMVLSLLEDKRGNLWFGTDGGGVSKYNGESFTTFSDKEGLANNIVSSLLEDKSGNLWFGTNGGGVSKYDGKSFSNFSDKEGLANNMVFSLLEDKSGNLWFGTRFGMSKLSVEKLVEINEKVKSNTLTEQDVIFKNYTYYDGFLGIGVIGGKTMCQAKDGTIWIASNDRLTAMHPDGMIADTIAPNIQLTHVELFNENIAWVNLIPPFEGAGNVKDTTIILGNGVTVSDFEFDSLSKWYSLPENLSLTYNNNYLTFKFIGISMNQPENVKYQYMLEGIDDNWSAVSNRTEATYGNLPHGSYTFKVKAMNSEGYWSKAFEYKFSIRPPFWQTWWFRTLVGLIIIGSIWYFIKSREKKLIAEKEKLERTVEERTAEVMEEKKVVEEQKHLIEEKHKEITDSINYAERIQRSFLATKELLDANLKDYFVLFKPKDVVSGDFYWAATIPSPLENGQRVGSFVLATADSTGHGVPGAIMSLLNITSLEKAIEHYQQPCDILNSTRKTIIERLKKDGSAEGGKDGMDCSLIVFDFVNKKLAIAAAHNPVWIMRQNEDRVTETLEVKPDKMPVGKHDRQDVSFTQQEIQLQPGDIVYTLTDGFADQFGGDKGKKFMSKNLREFLAANAHLPMAQQKQLLGTTFANWVGEMEQVDDVTIIGIRI